MMVFSVIDSISNATGTTSVVLTDSLSNSSIIIGAPNFAIASEGILEQMQQLGGSVATVAQNTQPHIFGMLDLVWWNFGIGMAALVAGVFAAVFGFLGFRYQKKAAIALEGRDGKAFQFEMILRMAYSNISSLIAIHQSWINNKKQVQNNKIEALKIPEDLIDPTVFTFDSSVYGKIVKLKRDMYRFRLDLDTYATYYGVDTKRGDKYYDILIGELATILDNIGIIMAAIHYSRTYRGFSERQNASNKEEAQQWYKSKIKSNPGSMTVFFIGPIFLILMLVYSLRTYQWFPFVITAISLICFIIIIVLLTTGYSPIKPQKDEIIADADSHCPFIAQAVIKEHKEAVCSSAKELMDNHIYYKKNVPKTIEECSKRFKWFTYHLPSADDCEMNEDCQEICSLLSNQSELLVDTYPHLGYYSKGDDIDLATFLSGTLALETTIKSLDQDFFE